MDIQITNTVGPFHSQFFNRNNQMNLKGHSHACRVYVEFAIIADTGFPAFAETNALLARKIQDTMGKPFLNHTNELVALILWEDLKDWLDPAPVEVAKWGGHYRLEAVHLDVLGVPDQIGHAEGWTRYTVRHVHPSQRLPV